MKKKKNKTILNIMCSRFRILFISCLRNSFHLRKNIGWPVDNDLLGLSQIFWFWALIIEFNQNSLQSQFSFHKDEKGNHEYLFWVKPKEQWRDGKTHLTIPPCCRSTSWQRSPIIFISDGWVHTLAEYNPETLLGPSLDATTFNWSTKSQQIPFLTRMINKHDCAC
jgi:hypothetical protein